MCVLGGGGGPAMGSMLKSLHHGPKGSAGSATIICTLPVCPACLDNSVEIHC